MTDATVPGAKEAPAATPLPKVLREKKVIEFVHCYSHGLAIYYWPLFVVPLIMGVLVHFGVVGGKAACWTVIFAYYLVGNVAFDLSRTAAFALGALVFGLVMAALFAQAQWQIPFFHWLGVQLSSIPMDWTLEVQGIFFTLAAIFFGLWCYEIVDSITDGKWVFSRNEFVHDQWGRRDKSLARGQCTVTVSTPDRFKWLLGLGGAQIEIHAAEDNNRVHAIIPNVIFGARKGRQIHALLQALQVVKLSS